MGLYTSLLVVLSYLHSVKGLEDSFVVMCVDIGPVDYILSDIFVISKTSIVLMDDKQPDNIESYNNENIITNSVEFSGNWTYSDACINGTTRAYRGVHIITSRHNIEDGFGTAVFRGGGMAEGYALIPVPWLGREYYAVTYCEIFGTCIVTIAGLQNTSVTVILPSNDDVLVEFEEHIYQGGQSITFDLQRKQAASVSCQCDLTGTIIRASKNVAVFSGSRSAIVGVANRRNFLIEQLPPTKNWGTEFAAANFLTTLRGSSLIRILASNSPAIVDMSGHGTFRLSEGQHMTKLLKSAKNAFITSSTPILVTVFVLNRMDMIKQNFMSSSMYIVAPTSSVRDQIVVGHWLPETNMELVIYGTPGVDKLHTETGNISIDLQRMLYFENSDFAAFRQKAYPDHGATIRLFEGQRSETTLSVHGAYLTTDGNTITFGSIHVPKTQKTTWGSGVYDGDGVDNDGDGLIDEDICEGYNPFEVSSTYHEDCMKSFSYDPDEAGRHFLVVFPTFGDNMHTLTVDIKKTQNAPVLNEPIGIRYLDSRCDFNISEWKSGPDYLHTISFPECNAIRSTGLYIRGVIVEVLDPAPYSEVVVVVSMLGNRSMASYTALPCDVLGTSYYAVTYCQDGRYCGCAVTALYTRTTIKIRLPDHDVEVYVAGESYQSRSMITKYMTQGETFFFTSTQDLTGTYISSSAPVAVICGGTKQIGIYIEQLPPVTSWIGWWFPIPRHISSLLIRVVVKEGNTYVREYGNDTKTHFLRYRGSYIDIDQANNSVHSISTSREGVLVVAVEDDGHTDGWMVVLASKIQSVQQHDVKWPDGSIETTLHVVDHWSTKLEKLTFQVLSEDYVDYETLNVTSEHVFNRSDIACTVSVASNYDKMTGFITGKVGYLGKYAISLHRYMTPAEVCTITRNLVADRIDNDCDGRIDEDTCVKEYHRMDTAPLEEGHYIMDYDLDGMIDEDCKIELSYTLSTTIESSTMMTSEITTISEMMTSSEWITSTPEIMTSQQQTTTNYITSYSELTISDIMPTSALLQTVLTATTTFEEADPSSVTLDPSFSSTFEPSVTVTYDNTVHSLQTSNGQQQTLSIASAINSSAVNIPPQPCSNRSSVYTNMTQKKLMTLVEKTKKQLTVNKTLLSSYIRKKTSAEDFRSSANTIGAFGTIMLVTMIGFIIVPDLASIVKYLQRATSIVV